MRISKLLLVCVCCVIAVPAALGQTAKSQAHQGILGYLDPHTGAFRPVAPAVQDNAELAAPVAPTTGTVTLTITVTLKTTGITKVTCNMITSVEDAITTSPKSIIEEDTVNATGSGSTRTCTLSIPYSWPLATAGSDTMSTDYTVTGSSGTTTTTLPIRSSSLSPVDTRKVPSSGTPTSLTAAATL